MIVSFDPNIRILLETSKPPTQIKKVSEVFLVAQIFTSFRGVDRFQFAVHLQFSRKMDNIEKEKPTDFCCC